MGLPFTPSTAMPSEQQLTQQTISDSDSANGQGLEGKSKGQPIEPKGAKPNQSRQQPVDMDKLLNVSKAVRKMAARATDAHAVLIKVQQAANVVTQCVSWALCFMLAQHLVFRFFSNIEAAR